MNEATPESMDDVLAGQAGDVRTRSANIFALDDYDAYLFSSKGPHEVLLVLFMMFPLQKVLHCDR
jgi:hypothetical protein